MKLTGDHTNHRSWTTGTFSWLQIFYYSHPYSIQSNDRSILRTFDLSQTLIYQHYSTKPECCCWFRSPDRSRSHWTSKSLSLRALRLFLSIWTLSNLKAVSTLGPVDQVINPRVRKRDRESTDEKLCSTGRDKMQPYVSEAFRHMHIAIHENKWDFCGVNFDLRRVSVYRH